MNQSSGSAWVSNHFRIYATLAMRWLGRILDLRDTGELEGVVADSAGAFSMRVTGGRPQS